LRSAHVGNAESISVPSATEGWHYFTIYGASAASDITLQVMRSYVLTPNVTTEVTLQPGESVLASVKVPALYPTPVAGGKFGAWFGLEFRVGIAVPFYVGDSSNVSDTSYLQAGRGRNILPDYWKCWRRPMKTKRIISNW